MTVRVFTIPLATLALTACGSPSTTDSAARTGDVNLTNASVAEVAVQARAAGDKLRFKPGSWETTVEVVEAEVPGVPDAMVKQMRDQMMAKSTTTSCMTPEQAANPTEKMFAGQQGNCRFERFKMQSGKIDSVMACTGDGKELQPARITMTGDFTATGFHLDNRIEAAPGTGPAIKMRSRITGKRVGECS